METHHATAVANSQMHMPTEQMVCEILEATAAHTGGDFFRALVSHLARALQTRHAFVTECTDHRMTRVRTLAYAKNGELVENIEYDLAGTPCAGVIQGAVCYHPEKLAALFPIEAGLESFLGAPICDSQGAILGHLAVRDDKALHVDPQVIEVLKIFATRAGIELERRRAEQTLIEGEQRLRDLNERLADSNRALEAMVATRTREIEQRRQVAESLRDMVLILNSERPLDEILAYIVETATRLLGTNSGAILTLQANGKQLAVQAMRGLPIDYAANLNLSVKRGLLGQAILNRQPVVTSNLAAALLEQGSASHSQRSALLANQYQAILTVPLIRQNPNGAAEEVYGVIALYYPEHRHFSDEEIELGMAFGAQAALAIENAQLRQRAERAAILEERSRLARELHDSVTQQLYSLTLLAEGWRRLAHSGQTLNIEDALAELGRLGQQALKELRLLIYELHPPDLQEAGLLAALHQRLAAVEQRTGVEARLIASGAFALPAPVEATLYRIAQEALNNCLKHAGATAVQVHLEAASDEVILEIVDNGCGFGADLQSRSGGLGLNNMRERAAQIGGKLTIHTAPGAGTTIRVVIPKGESEHG